MLQAPATTTVSVSKAQKETEPMAAKKAAAEDTGGLYEATEDYVPPREAARKLLTDDEWREEFEAAVGDFVAEQKAELENFLRLGEKYSAKAASTKAPKKSKSKPAELSDEHKALILKELKGKRTPVELTKLREVVPGASKKALAAIPGVTLVPLEREPGKQGPTPYGARLG